MTEPVTETRRLGTGVALVSLYALACALTLATGRVHVRPLFEGFAPSAPYRWVAPPPRFAAANVKPGSASASIAIQNGKSIAGALATDDGQFLANLAAGAIAAAPPATQVQAKSTPVDPATLGPLPAGLFADGNAYRLDLTLQPGAAPVASLAVAGNVVLTLPADGTAIAFSPDGRTWQQLTTQTVGGTHTTLGVSFDRPGFFLGVAASDVTGAGAAGGSKSGGGSSTGVVVLAVIGVVILVAVLVGAPLLIKKRRDARSSNTRRRPNQPNRKRR